MRKVMFTKNRLSLAISLLALGGSPHAFAQKPEEKGRATSTEDDGLTLRVRSEGEEAPLSDALNEKSGSEALQPERRVTVTQNRLGKAGKAILVGKSSVQLPGGGVVWATEDPNIGKPRLDISGPSLVAYDGSRVTKPVRFAIYSNYAPFISRGEVRIYRASDSDLVSPLAVLPVSVGAVTDVEWDGTMNGAPVLREGDELVYVLRVWGKDESLFDETFAKRVQLARPEDENRAGTLIRNQLESVQGVTLGKEEAEQRSLTEGVFGNDSLRQQNIPIYGSRVRIQGRDLPEKAMLKINGENHPVDLERKMVAEYLVPVGQHKFELEMRGEDGAVVTQTLEADVSGKYLFMVGLADLTLSANDLSGSIEPLAADDRMADDMLAEGRLAFYLKGKIKGKYLITAQADTDEREIGNLFKGFFNADPRDVFRRLDPDAYYPVYGDDSTTTRDVDTQGRMYLRVDWDKNQVLFGNFSTGFTGTEYAQYQRSLFGAAASLRSRGSNAWGDAKSEFRAFGSEAQSAAGHSEFLGTGGSLYYLKHTDVLPGSEKVVMEVRDPTTGRVENIVTLARGADYEIDELQGRIILTRPLAQVAREAITTISRDRPLDGYTQTLMVDYEYVPTGLSLSETTVGLRGKQWLGDHLAIGGTYIDENRAGDDYSLKGVDVTLQAGKGTYIKAEHSRSKSTSAPVFYSDNGGLSFVERNAGLGTRKGDATSIEGRINFHELGVSSRDWTAGAWWRDVDAGYSVARFDQGQNITEYGAETRAQIGDGGEIYVRYSRAERGLERFTQAQVTGEWRFGEASLVAAELRHVDEDRTSGSSQGTLGALKVNHRIGGKLDLYATGQMVVDREGAYADNDALTLGAKYRLGTLSNVGAEFTTGDRGDSAQANAEIEIGKDHTLYGAYTYSTDRTAYDPLFNPRSSNGLTIGQKWRPSSKVNLFNESQYLKAPESQGLSHTYGMDFYPGQGWNLGFTTQVGKLERDIAGGGVSRVDRHAFSVSGGFTSARAQWQSKLEWRKDTGAERREQWVTTNQLGYKVSESLRLAARFNYSETEDKLNPSAGAKFAEANIGFALRPWNTTRWALFGKYTWLYDVSALEQVGGNVANYDQQSNIFSVEGIYTPSRNWEFSGKLMRRGGSVRFGRLEGQWADSAALFGAAQVRYGLRDKWHALVEYRVLDVKDGGTRQGFLAGIDRDLTNNLRIGVGYNFTDFSDDLTRFDYRYKGAYLNLVGRF